MQLFPTWNLKEADGLWCAAFVYYCCTAAGFGIPYRPDECKTCHLAACLGWEEFAVGDRRIEYHKGPEGCVPETGDIVLYDRVFENKEHDHIGAYAPGKELAKPDETLLEFANQMLPPEIVYLWNEYGFGDYGDGLIKVVDPRDYMDSLYSWLGGQDFHKILDKVRHMFQKVM